MKIFVTFATESEFRPWRRLRPFHQTGTEGNSVYETRMGEAQVYVVLTGMGPENAARVIRTTLRNSAHICVSSGLAGGLKSEHSLGEVLVARALRADGKQRFFKTDQSLVKFAVRCGAKAVDLFYTSAAIVLTAEQKSGMGALADAVEMESFAIMKEASACGIPAVAIRAISDPVGVDLPLDFNQVFGQQGHLSASRALSQLVRNPHRLPALARFGFESLRAASSLTRFLDRYVELLASQGRFREALSQVGT